MDPIKRASDALRKAGSTLTDAADELLQPSGVSVIEPPSPPTVEIDDPSNEYSDPGELDTVYDPTVTREVARKSDELARWRRQRGGGRTRGERPSSRVRHRYAYKVHPNGAQVWNPDTGKYERLQKHNDQDWLEYVIKVASKPGDVIEVNGRHPEMTLGAGANGQAGDVADDIILVGGGDAVINGIRIWGSDGDLTLMNIEVENRRNVFAPIWLQNEGEALAGRLTCDNITLTGLDGEWRGYGKKWGIKGTGYPAQGIVVVDSDLSVGGGALEHNVYVKNVPVLQRYENLVCGNTERTAIQTAERKWPNGEGNPGGPLPPTLPNELIFKNIATRNHHTQGGSAISVFGNRGPVLIEDVFVDGTAQGTDMGAIAITVSTYHSGPDHKYNGFWTGPVTLRNVGFNLTDSQRDHIMVSGAQSLVIEFEPEGIANPHQWVGSKTGLDLEKKGPNGPVQLIAPHHLLAMDGVYRHARLGNHWLTEGEIKKLARPQIVSDLID